jgi:hypothetical protein
MGLGPAKVDEDSNENRLAGESACSTLRLNVGQALPPANSDVFNGALRLLLSW